MVDVVASRDDDQRQTDVGTLRDLRAEYPHLHIGTEFYGRTQVWVARGEDGHPWLVASDDLTRFRHALRQQ
jgi:hypothetical protein